MNKILTLIACFAFGTFNAQTKLIAYKSHSGNTEKFNETISKDLFNSNDSNLGHSPFYYVKNAQLDSVIFIDETKTVIVTSEYCKNLIIERKGNWNPGKDTLVNNPYFSISNLNNIKTELKNNFYFENPIDSVIFLKYNKEDKSYEKIIPNETSKIEPENKLNNQNKLSFLGIITLSGMFGYFGIRRKK